MADENVVVLCVFFVESVHVLDDDLHLDRVLRMGELVKLVD